MEGLLKSKASALHKSSRQVVASRMSRHFPDMAQVWGVLEPVML